MLWFSLSTAAIFDVAASNLKTSYVMVQLITALIPTGKPIEFKNILCYGSADAIERIEGILNNLKTSYVMVQQCHILDFCIECIYLKTSYVMVQPQTSFMAAMLAMNLKTSYVMVQQRWYFRRRRLSEHLKTSYVMVQRQWEKEGYRRFSYLKTSYVMVQLFQLRKKILSIQFKNILCYGSASGSPLR